MKVAIHQPNYIPWIGYFQKISQVDHFVLFDDVQFERGKSFTSRAKILVQGNELWQTIPIINKSDLININKAQVDTDSRWKKKQLKTIELAYKKAPFFNDIFEIISEVYDSNSKLLVDYNIPLIIKLSRYLEIGTKFVKSSEIEGHDKSTTGFDKILDILKNVEADEYLSGSGTGSRRYIDEEMLLKNNIELKWQDFEFKEYRQLKTKEFVPGLSIIDLLFNKGKESVNYL